MSRPSDHFDSPASQPRGSGDVAQPKLTPLGYLRFFWRQLTSMRTALFLLLLLAIAAVPGSLFSQRSSDPNGVLLFFKNNPTLAPVLDKFQLFDVYTSAWFSAIYLLLFVSLVGCVIPRTIFHAKALASPPPKTPARLERLEAFTAYEIVPGQTDAASVPITSASTVEAARSVLRRAGYRVKLFSSTTRTSTTKPGTDQAVSTLSVSAERGYLRETGNLVFHTALIGILISVGIGGGFGYTGQKVLVVGQAFANVRLTFDSFTPGRFFSDALLVPYRLKVTNFTAKYEEQNKNAYGQPIDYTADVTAYNAAGTATKEIIKVNDPLEIGGNEVYLLGNGYAPKIVVRDPEGTVVFSDSVPCLPQDANLTSSCVVKVPDGLKEQLGMRGFFYPTSVPLESGALTSSSPNLLNPELTFFVYKGDLGINDGTPTSVYSLDTDKLTEIAGLNATAKSIQLKPGETAQLPQGLGSITFENAAPRSVSTSDPASIEKSVPRYVSLDIHRDPTQGWVLFFAICVLAGLLTSLFIPRRRVWVKVIEQEDGSLRVEYAGLARGEDPTLTRAVDSIAERHSERLGLKLTP